MLTQKEVKRMLHYNPKTGEFIWIINRDLKYNKNHPKVQKKGELAGYNDYNGYLIIRCHKIEYKAHRLAFLYMNGYFPENLVDHINMKRDDNKWSNLREVSYQCNCLNSKVSTSNNSGVKGVGFNKDKQKWTVRIQKWKSYYLGDFEDFDDAVMARWKGEVQYNFPDCQTSSSAYNYLKDKDLIKGNE